MENKTGLRRIYRKSWPYDNLFGSLPLELDIGQRGLWNCLLDFAKISRVRPGLIAAAPGVAYKHRWLADFFNVPLEILEGTLEVLKKTNRINENHDGIEIINWAKYQTDSDRQRPYRQKKKLAEQDPKRYKKQKYGHMVKS